MLKYIPAHYVKKQNKLFTLWHKDGVAPELLEQVFTQALEKINAIYSPCVRDFEQNYKVGRPGAGFDLNLCVYADIGEARKSLKREIPDTMLMCPFIDDKRALIICMSENANEKNGNRDRLLRHLMHELVHVHIALETGSPGELGDHMQHLKIPVWLDEGLAEYISLSLTHADETIRKAHEYYSANKFDLTEIENEMMNVESKQIESRVNAYKYALGKVSSLLSGTPRKDNVKELLNKYRRMQARTPRVRGRS